MTRHLRHGLVAGLVTIVTGLAWGALEVPGPSRATQVEAAGQAEGRVRVTLADDGATHEVRLQYGNRRAGTVLPPGADQLVVELPPLPAVGTVVVEVEPPVRVTVGSDGDAVAPTRWLRWEQAEVPAQLPTPQRGPVTTAPVDETDVFGVRPLGVPLRSRPDVWAPAVGTVFHGEVLQAICWTRGDPVTDGFPSNRERAYTSDVWFGVAWQGGQAFLPDTRFSRTGHGDRLGLPTCPR